MQSGRLTHAGTMLKEVLLVRCLDCSWLSCIFFCTCEFQLVDDWEVWEILTPCLYCYHKTTEPSHMSVCLRKLQYTMKADGDVCSHILSINLLDKLLGGTYANKHCKVRQQETRRKKQMVRLSTPPSRPSRQEVAERKRSHRSRLTQMHRRWGTQCALSCCATMPWQSG